jgi:hypothetical protein
MRLLRCARNDVIFKRPYALSMRFSEQKRLKNRMDIAQSTA